MLDHVAHEPANAPRSNSASTSSPSNGTHRIESQRLLAGGRELVIDHAGRQYRLRLTRNDKLILTR